MNSSRVRGKKAAVPSPSPSHSDAALAVPNRKRQRPPSTLNEETPQTKEAKPNEEITYNYSDDDLVTATGKSPLKPPAPSLAVPNRSFPSSINDAAPSVPTRSLSTALPQPHSLTVSTVSTSAAPCRPTPPKPTSTVAVSPPPFSSSSSSSSPSPSPSPSPSASVSFATVEFVRNAITPLEMKLDIILKALQSSRSLLLSPSPSISSTSSSPRSMSPPPFMSELSPTGNSASSTISSTSRRSTTPTATTSARQTQRDWRRENRSLVSGGMAMAEAAWNTYAANHPDEMKKIDWDEDLKYSPNMYVVDAITSSIGSVSDFPPEQLLHFVKECFRKRKIKISQHGTPLEVTELKASTHRRRERKKTRTEYRKQRLRQNIGVYQYNHGIVPTGGNWLPGDESNYRDMDTVLNCDDMLSDDESGEEEWNGKVVRVTYRHGVPHRSQLCSTYLSILDMEKRPRSNNIKVGKDEKKVESALATHRDVDVARLAACGMPPRMLNLSLNSVVATAVENAETDARNKIAAEISS